MTAVCRICGKEINLHEWAYADGSKKEYDSDGRLIAKPIPFDIVWNHPAGTFAPYNPNKNIGYLNSIKHNINQFS